MSVVTFSGLARCASCDARVAMAPLDDRGVVRCPKCGGDFNKAGRTATGAGVTGSPRNEDIVRDCILTRCWNHSPDEGVAALDALVAERDEALARLSSIGGWEGYSNALDGRERRAVTAETDRDRLQERVAFLEAELDVESLKHEATVADRDRLTAALREIVEWDCPTGYGGTGFGHVRQIARFALAGKEWNL